MRKCAAEGTLAIEKHNLNIDFLHELGEDKQIELINGHLIYSEAPNLRHQIYNFDDEIPVYIYD